MSELAAQLDYAPPPAVPRGRRARRAAIIVGAVLLLTGAALVTPRAARRMQVVYWQTQCMNYAAPADQVIHATDQAELPRLLRPNSGYGGSFPSGQAFLVPPAYRNFAGNMNVARSVGTAFMQRRTSSNGGEGLVVVDLHIINLDSTQKFMVFRGEVIEPGGPFVGPRYLLPPTTGDGSQVILEPGDTYRVFAGQPDPADASHFTIDYVLNDQRATLDGWLNDDGMVRIEKRD